MASLDNERLRQTLFISGLVLIALIIFWELRMFLSGFLGAVTLYVLLRKSMLFLTEKQRHPKSLAALGLILASYILILTPIGAIIQLLFSKLSQLNIDSNQIHDGVVGIVRKIKEATGFEVLSEESFGELRNVIGNSAQILLNTTYSMVMNAIMLFFILYFMLTNIHTLDEAVRRLIPLSPEHTEKVIEESSKVLISNAVGIPLVAIIQGIVATVGYIIFGAEDPIFWGMITGLFGIIPIVGTAVIWIPMTVHLMISFSPWQGIGLLLYCVVLVSTSDNLIRFLLQKKMADIHPIITVLGVILGVNLFGFLGIIFGPLLLSIFILLVRIYRLEYLPSSRQEEGGLADDAPDQHS